jgi:predicted transcriptional regulator
MSTVKVTKKTRFEEMKAIFEAQGDTVHAEFCQHEIELLNKKNSKTSGKLTKTQKENEAIKAEILEGLEGKMTITEMTKNIPAIEGMTNQKVSALVRQLVKEEKVVRTEEKGRAFFEIAPEGEEE